MKAAIEPKVRGADAADSELYRSLLAKVESMLQTLPDKPEETADSALRCLWHLAAGTPLSPQAAVEATLPVLDGRMQSALLLLVERRLSGVPLAHLSGRQRFMGLEMLAGPQALIPRRETELLARRAIEILRDHVIVDGNKATVFDVCTGCGNLAAAMAHADTRVQVYASDLSEEAVALARRNVEQLGLAGRVELRCGDLLEPLREPRFLQAVDLIVCNPPYISTKKMQTMPGEIVAFEPALAFDGGPLGVRILQRLIREAPALLRPAGWLLFEVGLGQGRAVMQRMLASEAYAQIDGITDEQGEIRVVMARV